MKLFQEPRTVQHDSNHPLSEWKTRASLSLQRSVQQDSGGSQLSSNVVPFHFVKTRCERSRSWTSRL